MKVIKVFKLVNILAVRQIRRVEVSASHILEPGILLAELSRGKNVRLRFVQDLLPLKSNPRPLPFLSIRLISLVESSIDTILW